MIKHLFKAIKNACKRFLWSCKSTISVIKSDRSSIALKFSKIISQLMKIAGTVMSMVGLYDFVGLKRDNTRLKEAIDKFLEFDDSELLRHFKDIPRYKGMIRFFGGAMVKLVGRLIEKGTDSVAAKQGITTHDSMPWSKMHRVNDDLIEIFMYVPKLIGTAIGTIIGKIIYFIKQVRIKGYSKDIEVLLRKGELSEKEVIRRLKNGTIEYLNNRLKDISNPAQRRLVLGSIKKLSQAKYFDDFAFMRGTPIYSQIEREFRAYELARKRLDEELNNSKRRADRAISDRYSLC